MLNSADCTSVKDGKIKTTEMLIVLKMDQDARQWFS